MIREGYFPADIVFGYFSNKDGLRHRWDLCERCYDALIHSFQIPVEESEESELVRVKRGPGAARRQQGDRHPIVRTGGSDAGCMFIGDWGDDAAAVSVAHLPDDALQRKEYPD